MIAHKHITKIVAVIMAIAACFCLYAIASAEQLVTDFGDTGISLEYEEKLFDTSKIISVNIIMEDSEWADMLTNATAEDYYQCDVVINGETYYRVGIRPKGNTSLSSIASDPNTDRYSLKLEFDHYVDGQTCYGLDKLILNNNYADATNMKEALIYDMYQYIGADASLYNYANISVNGEYWGVYLALEAVEDSFLLRNFGTESGELYKPDSMEIGGGGGAGRENVNPGGMAPGGMDISNMTPPTNNPSVNGGNETTQAEQGGNNLTAERPMAGARPDMGEGGRGGFTMGGNGADLNYIDDELDSYSTIWDGEVTDTSDSDHKRVVTALKNISEGTDLEEYMDIDNLLKYAAVHIFSVNADSLSGNMAHNYYLYERDGQLNLLPWDYNLSLGGMGTMSASATDTVNDAIDNAFSGTKFFDALLAEEEYHAQYYAYLQQLVDEYLLGDGFERFYNRTRTQIDELVKTDPNALYTYEEYIAAHETLYEVVKLRGKSIDGQINKTIPSTKSEQRNSDTLIDASHLDLSVMGVMNMGGGGGNSNTPPQAGGGMPGNTQSNNDEINNNTAKEQTQGPFDTEKIPNVNPGNNGSTSTMQNLITYAICVAVLLVALVFAKCYKRKPRKR